MTNAFNPMVPLLQGQQAEQNLSQAELEGIQLRERMALRKAAAKFGQGNYFAGMEGIKGAERPDAIKEAYASGDIETAMKLEAMASEDAKLNRGIGIAGKTEQAKKEADYTAAKNAFPGFFGEDAIGNLNAFAREGPAPSSPAVGEPQSAETGTPAPAASNYSGLGRALKLTPQGLNIEATRMPEVTRQQGIEDITSKKAATALNEKQYKQKAEQDAITNIRDTQNQIAEQEKLMPLRQGSPVLLQQLRDQLVRQRKEYENIATGKTQVTPPVSVPQQPQPVPTPSRGPGLTPVAPIAPIPQSSSGAPALNEYERASLAKESQKEKTTAANVEINNARAHAMKIQESLPLVDEMFNLVTKQNIGHPELEGVPGAGNALSLNRANAQVQKIWGALTNMFIEKGQSQLMNTIVERTITAAMVPSLFTEPQLNKKLAATLKSNVTHMRNLPSFLERWQKDHNGTLDGAADTWVNYVKENPIYTSKTDARGKVTVMENSHVKPVTQWMKDTRTIGGITYQRQEGGGWKAK